MSVIGSKLRSIRKGRGLTQAELSIKVGVSNSDISQWETGKYQPSQSSLAKLAAALGVTVGYFFDEPPAEPTVRVLPAGFVRVPVFDAHCSAGTFRDTPSDCIVSHLDLPESICPHTDVGAVQVSGDSMAPTINDGDYVVFSKIQAVKTNSLAIVIIDDEGIALKRIRNNRDGTLYLASDNPKYPPRLVKESEIDFIYRVVARVNTF